MHTFLFSWFCSFSLTWILTFLGENSGTTTLARMFLKNLSWSINYMNKERRERKDRKHTEDQSRQWVHSWRPSSWQQIWRTRGGGDPQDWTWGEWGHVWVQTRRELQKNVNEYIPWMWLIFYRWHTASGGDHVLGEVVEELLDVVIVQFLKLEASPDDTLVEVEGFVVEAATDVLENVEPGSRALLLQTLYIRINNGFSFIQS